jgi:peptidylprolyl isomerase
MRAENGKRVKVQFTGRLEDGTVFLETTAEKPLEFTLGQEGIISGFVEAVNGMEPGQEKTVHVSPEKGFGKYDVDKLVSFKRGEFAESDPIKRGAEVLVKDVNGREYAGRIDSFTDESITLDMNHPLAGKELEFDIRLQEVA